MARGPAAAPAAPAPVVLASPGVYSATYSGIPVYEFVFGADMKESVMRRRLDNWINATHILKAAGFDKPTRTRILEREVQKDTHEKIQGGYGKYQGTWIPLESGRNLAMKNNVFEKIHAIFDYDPRDGSPPPAPRMTKPKARKPAVPKTTAASATPAIAQHHTTPIPPPMPPNSTASFPPSLHHPPSMAPPMIPLVSMSQPLPSHPASEYDSMSIINDDDTTDNVTIASASFLAEDDRIDSSLSTIPPQQQQQQQQQNSYIQQRQRSSNGNSSSLAPPVMMSSSVGPSPRKRKHEEETLQDLTEQQHSVYGDALLDYFLLSRHEKPGQVIIRPEPPVHFQPDWVIDSEGHTALHWASAMGDVEVIRQLKQYGASLEAKNIRGETPFMHAVNFTNCYEKDTFPIVLKEFWDTVGRRDLNGGTVIHHAATTRTGRITGQSCSRYYLDNILNTLMETHDPTFAQQLVDAQDKNGDTALHLAARRGARKCVRSLIGRHASTDLANHEGVTAEELIMILNAECKNRNTSSHMHPRSSSPFGPDHTNLTITSSLPHHLQQQQSAYLHDEGRKHGFKSTSDSPYGHPGGRDGSDSRLTDGAAEDTLLSAPHTALLNGGGPYEDGGRVGRERERKAGRASTSTTATTLPKTLAAEVSFQSEAARTIHTSIMPLVFEKLQSLSRNFEEDWLEQDTAEKEAHQILRKTQNELAVIQQEIEQLQKQLDSEETERAAQSEAETAKEQMAQTMQRHATLRLEDAVQQKLPSLLVDPSLVQATPEATVAMARELQVLLAEQRSTEQAYLEALSVLGTGEKIDRYRRLLQLCLESKDVENLDENLDHLIEMMEEEVDDVGRTRTSTATTTIPATVSVPLQPTSNNTAVVSRNQDTMTPTTKHEVMA